MSLLLLLCNICIPLRMYLENFSQIVVMLWAKQELLSSALQAEEAHVFNMQLGWSIVSALGMEYYMLGTAISVGNTSI